METLRLDNICKIYKGKSRREDDVVAVKDFNLVVEDNEFIVFVGPSGCGKSTTLRMIAGLEDISSGNLYIDGELVNNIEPNYRNIAMVFQNYALYPHMTAYNNMAFGLKNRHVPKDEIDKKIHEAAKILDIEDLLKRKPKAMSGGQRQRVALGRAIVRTPKIFLLDEPLSNLDAKLRSQMRVEINKLYEKLKTTFIYVTHDQVEAMTMGTRIVVMRKGIVQQIDTPTTLYDYPRNRFVAGFLGTPQMNFYECSIQKRDKDLEISLLDYKIKYPLRELREIHKDYLDGEKHNVIMGIRPDNLELSTEKEGIKAKISIIEVLGNETLLYADLNLNSDHSISESETTVVISVQGRSNLKMGDIVTLKLNPHKIHLFKNNENDETSIMLTPKTKRNEIKCFVEVENGKAIFKTDEKYSFEIPGLDATKFNEVFLHGMHRVKIDFNDSINFDKNGKLKIIYQGEGLIDGELKKHFDLKTSNSYDDSFDETDTHLYLSSENLFEIGEEVTASIDLERLRIAGDDGLSIFDKTEKNKELDEYKLVEVKEETHKKSILKIFNKNKKASIIDEKPCKSECKFILWCKKCWTKFISIFKKGEKNGNDNA